MRNLLLALMLAGTHCVLSQETPADKSKRLATLQGRAVISMTGEPVSRADLTLRALPPGTDTVKVASDADGYFSFEDMVPGSYILSARRSGFPAEVYGAGSQGSGGTPLTLSAGQVLTNIEFRLTPLGTISGTVVDDRGKPISEVRVIATGSTSKSNGTVVTDSTGEFRFPNLAPGSYTLWANPSGTPPTPAARTPAGEPGQLEERLVATYYPSATDALGAIPLDVAPGQDLQGIKIAVRKVPLYHVRGKVATSSADISPENLGLWLMPRTPGTTVGPASSSGGTPAPDGSFDLGGVRPGSYYLAARLSSDRVGGIIRGDLSNPEVSGPGILGRAWVDVTDGDVTGIVLRVGEPLRIMGTIRIEGQDKPDLSGVRIQLRFPDVVLQASEPRATMGAENTFTLSNVSPAKYAVFVSGLPGGAYVKSIRLGSQETIDTGLDLTDMQAVPPLEIRIGRDGATVQGIVDRDDDKPAPRAWVALIPDPARPGLASRLKSATATEGGSFILTGVAPGEYRLYAFEQQQPRSLVSLESFLEFFGPFESKSVRVTVKEGERKLADLTVLKPQAGP